MGRDRNDLVGNGECVCVCVYMCVFAQEKSPYSGSLFPSLRAVVLPGRGDGFDLRRSHEEVLLVVLDQIPFSAPRLAREAAPGIRGY